MKYQLHFLETDLTHPIIEDIVVKEEPKGVFTFIFDADAQTITINDNYEGYKINILVDGEAFLPKEVDLLLEGRLIAALKIHKQLINEPIKIYKVEEV